MVVRSCFAASFEILMSIATMKTTRRKATKRQSVNTASVNQKRDGTPTTNTPWRRVAVYHRYRQGGGASSLPAAAAAVCLFQQLDSYYFSY